MTILMQTACLFLLAIPIACVAWTVTHEMCSENQGNIEAVGIRVHRLY